MESCSNHSKKRTWESQSYKGKIPDGNILTSAAILYSGTLLSKALQVFQILNFATINRKTFFFRHQSQYIQPAINSVEKCSQELLLRSLEEKENPLVLAGDGQSDGHRHSAKCGSYSILGVTVNKIVDFKSVQV